MHTKTSQLTERQSRELEYHRDHAAYSASVVDTEIEEAVIKSPNRRWWNHYWEMYSYFQSLNLASMTVLVDGCGFGKDVLSICSMGAKSVDGNDLSPESIVLAKQWADNLGIATSHFVVAPCETLPYPDNSFDMIVFLDILHHVDIPKTLSEAQRVLKPEGKIVISEPYTHTVTQRLLRKNMLVEKVLYPALKKFIYQTDKPYITEDERKLNNKEVDFLKSRIEMEKFSYFYIILTRLVPSRFAWFARIDRLICKALGPLGYYLGARFLMVGQFKP